MNRPGLREVMIAGLLCLTLGLAPFGEESHLVGKLRWVAGGGEGMQWIDYGDLLMHGFPWALLVIAVVRWGMLQRTTQ